MTEFDVKHTALALLKHHGRGNWVVTINRRTKTQAGRCNYRKCEIQIGEWVIRLNDDKAVLNVITHEVAHAIVGGFVAHNHVWRQCHRRLGGNGKARYKAGECLVNNHVRRKQKPNWVATCPTCGKVITKVRLSKKLGTRYQCARDKTLLDWRNLMTGVLSNGYEPGKRPVLLMKILKRS